VTVAYLILEGHLESGALRLSEEHDECLWGKPEELKVLKGLCPQFQRFANEYYGEQAQDR
jgi:hypothetical protein